jgi:hypothetical protein
MFRLMGRVQMAYIGLFVLVCAGVFAYEAMYIWPMERCESDGGWWSAKYRQCATPIPIWRFTGRLPGEPRAATPVSSAPAGAKS